MNLVPIVATILALTANNIRAEAIDWDKANAAIAKVTAKIQSGETDLSELEATIDTFASDFDTNRLLGQVRVGTTKAPWGNGHADLVTDVDIVGKVGPKIATTRIATTMFADTDMLSALAAASRAMQPQCATVDREASETMSEIEGAFACNVADAMALPRISDMRTSIAAAHRKEIEGFRYLAATLEARKASEGDPDNIAEIDYELEKLNANIATLSSLVVSGSAETLTIAANFEFQIFYPIRIDANLTLSSGQAQLIAVAQSEMNVDDFQFGRSVAETFLRRIADEDPSAILQAESSTRSAIDSMKALLAR